jgi:large subunit ribosomal protein L13
MNKIERKLHQLDAAGQTVGRLATKIAIILRGKNKPEYQPYLDLGDIVEIKNINKLRFTGNKLEQKEYYHFSGFIGGLKTKKMKQIYEKNPGEILRRAVREMLPPTKLRPNMLKRLIIK